MRVLERLAYGTMYVCMRGGVARVWMGGGWKKGVKRRRGMSFLMSLFGGTVCFVYIDQISRSTRYRG